jgi:hypothetical protein
VSIGFILNSNMRRPMRRFVEKHLGGDVLHIELANQVSFLNRAALSKVLAEVPRSGHVLLDAQNTDYIDPDVLDLIRDFKEQTGPARGVEVSLLGFRSEYQFDDQIQYVDYSTREIYEAQGFPITKAGTLDSADIHPLRYSYNNYADQIKKLWDGYGKPVIIGETGWDHTYYEPGMPGYLAMHHNVLWVSLATGTSMTPFWWAFSGRMNDIIVSNQLLSIRKFSDNIPFSKLTNLSRINISIADGDGFGMQSDKLIYGWVVNPKTDVAGDKVTISAAKNGRYKLKLFHTWRGEFIGENEITASDNTLSFSIPSLKTKGGHANYIGQDVAFILEAVPEAPSAAAAKTKKK